MIVIGALTGAVTGAFTFNWCIGSWIINEFDIITVKGNCLIGDGVF